MMRRTIRFVPYLVLALNCFSCASVEPQAAEAPAPRAAAPRIRKDKIDPHAPLTPELVEQNILLRGEAPVIKDLMGQADSSETIISAITAGDSSWLKLYPVIRRHAGSSWNIQLDIAVGNAVEVNPSDSLMALGQTSEIEVSTVCGLTREELLVLDSPNQQPLLKKIRDRLNRRAEQIKTISNRDLAEVVSSCQSGLEKALKTWAERRIDFSR